MLSACKSVARALYVFAAYAVITVTSFPRVFPLGLIGSVIGAVFTAIGSTVSLLPSLLSVLVSVIGTAGFILNILFIAYPFVILFAGALTVSAQADDVELPSLTELLLVAAVAAAIFMAGWFQLGIILVVVLCVGGMFLYPLFLLLAPLLQSTVDEVWAFLCLVYAVLVPVIRVALVIYNGLAAIFNSLTYRISPYIDFILGPALSFASALLGILVEVLGDPVAAMECRSPIRSVHVCVGYVDFECPMERLTCLLTDVGETVIDDVIGGVLRSSGLVTASAAAMATDMVWLTYESVLLVPAFLTNPTLNGASCVSSPCVPLLNCDAGACLRCRPVVDGSLCCVDYHFECLLNAWFGTLPRVAVALLEIISNVPPLGSIVDFVRNIGSYLVGFINDFLIAPLNTAIVALFAGPINIINPIMQDICDFITDLWIWEDLDLQCSIPVPSGDVIGRIDNPGPLFRRRLLFLVGGGSDGDNTSASAHSPAVACDLLVVSIGDDFRLWTAHTDGLTSLCTEVFSDICSASRESRHSEGAEPPFSMNAALLSECVAAVAFSEAHRGHAENPDALRIMDTILRMRAEGDGTCTSVLRRPIHPGAQSKTDDPLGMAAACVTRSLTWLPALPNHRAAWAADRLIATAGRALLRRRDDGAQVAWDAPHRASDDAALAMYEARARSREAARLSRAQAQSDCDVGTRPIDTSTAIHYGAINVSHSAGSASSSQTRQSYPRPRASGERTLLSAAAESSSAASSSSSVSIDVSALVLRMVTCAVTTAASNVISLIVTPPMLPSGSNLAEALVRDAGDLAAEIARFMEGVFVALVDSTMILLRVIISFFTDFRTDGFGVVRFIYRITRCSYDPSVASPEPWTIGCAFRLYLPANVTVPDANCSPLPWGVACEAGYTSEGLLGNYKVLDTGEEIDVICPEGGYASCTGNVPVGSAMLGAIIDVFLEMGSLFLGGRSPTTGGLAVTVTDIVNAGIPIRIRLFVPINITIVPVSIIPGLQGILLSGLDASGRSRARSVLPGGILALPDGPPQTESAFCLAVVAPSVSLPLILAVAYVMFLLVCYGVGIAVAPSVLVAVFAYVTGLVSIATAVRVQHTSDRVSSLERRVSSSNRA
jgi:hypothetical protein